MVTLLNRKQQIWQWRFELINNEVDYESLREWRESAERMHAFLDYYLENQQTFHANLLQRISAAEMSLEENHDPQLKEGLQNRLRALGNVAHLQHGLSHQPHGRQAPAAPSVRRPLG